MRWRPRGRSEALTGGVRAGLLSRETALFQGADVVPVAEGETAGGVSGESLVGPARSEIPGTYDRLHAREPRDLAVARWRLVMPRPGWFAGCAARFLWHNAMVKTEPEHRDPPTSRRRWTSHGRASRRVEAYGALALAPATPASVCGRLAGVRGLVPDTRSVGDPGGPGPLCARMPTGAGSRNVGWSRMIELRCCGRWLMKTR